MGFAKRWNRDLLALRPGPLVRRLKVRPLLVAGAGERNLSWANIIFYATAVDAELIRRFINDEPQVAWIVKVAEQDRTYTWRAVDRLDAISEQRQLSNFVKRHASAQAWPPNTSSRRKAYIFPDGSRPSAARTRFVPTHARQSLGQWSIY